MLLARLFAFHVGDADRRWAMLNARVATTAIVFLLVAIAARTFGWSWGVGLGFAVGTFAVVGAGVNVWHNIGGEPTPVATRASSVETRRVSRLLRRGRPILEQDAELADGLARTGLRTFGVIVWSGLLVGCGQIGAVAVRALGNLVELLLMAFALGLSIVSLVMVSRLRRGLLEPSAGPTR